LLSTLLLLHSIAVGTIFQDHASRYIYTHLQESTNAQETLNAKLAFESLMHTYGIQIHHYRADAGAFASAPFMDKIKQSKQTINFSAPGYHEQNGIAERTIRTLPAKARTMLIHPSSHWSSDVHNSTPSSRSIDPKVTRSKKKSLYIELQWIRPTLFFLLRVTLGPIILLGGVEL